MPVPHNHNKQKRIFFAIHDIDNQMHRAIIPFEMLINISDYNVTQNDVPVLTRADDGTYIQTNCLLNNFNIYSGDLTNILTGFDYKNNILDLIRQYGHSPGYSGRCDIYGLG